MIQFWVPGKPQAQGSKTKTRFVLREDNKEVGPWRERIALAAHAAMNGDGLLEGAVALDLRFTLYRPASAPKRRTPPATKKPDLDKLQRAVFDALTGVCFRDDSQVVFCVAGKHVADIGEPMGVLITVDHALCDTP